MHLTDASAYIAAVGGKCLVLVNYYEGIITVKLNNVACMFTRGRLIIVD
jgi:hypothetical protein